MPGTSSLPDTLFIVLLTFAITLIQTLYRIWDKKDSKVVLDKIVEANKEVVKTLSAENKITMDLVSKAIEGLTPHLERNRKVLEVVQDLHSMHNVRDEDGRPMWYTPKGVIETQRKLVDLAQISTTTQDRISVVIERQNTDFTKLFRLCEDQFQNMKDEMRRAVS